MASTVTRVGVEAEAATKSLAHTSKVPKGAKRAINVTCFTERPKEMLEEDMEDHQDRTVLAGELKAGSLSSTSLAGDINNSNTMEAI